ncbi:hypothetical protein CDAR_482051 [Caerostris darwini]|uniref:Secreted protein n=1 Tax=Caerostris darwini TaxID=1538125 RepID=A0AAV4TKL2_9ARAC|nr:hypothetical protein CDAR_482051 [Caerostris darwini]
MFFTLRERCVGFILGAFGCHGYTFAKGGSGEAATSQSGGSEAFLPVFCRRKGTRRSFATTGDKTLTPHQHTPLHLLHPFQTTTGEHYETDSFHITYIRFAMITVHKHKNKIIIARTVSFQS